MSSSKKGAPDDVDRYQLFSELKAEIFKRQSSNAENFDKAILTYASGGLALSLAFLKDFLPLGKSSFTWSLYSSWLLFALSITVTVASFLTSQLAQTRQLQLAERYYLDEDDGALKEKNTPGDWTNYLNWASGLFFCVAVLLTTAFVGVNAKDALPSKQSNPGSPMSSSSVTAPTD